ncbi:ABC transporter substrate-binding protein [Albimonas pacifica]|uniref:Iron(III) transport system substrate-binding protein n=1 Tax=Albimonas pacifica TaxID=1114924 RepID=A0A1I3BRD7_9RHOB|nr:extracellular solute-binding protein [Albimonas pacifica]SFH64857.1 iron(III) transport system substrate-binding protein [Albimonas pacifica]
MTLDRRTFLAASAAAAAAAAGLRPFGARAQDSLAALHEAAKAEGELTWYIVPMSSESAERAAAKFTETYPGVEVNVVRSTAQVAFQRLNQDIDTGVNNADVFTTSNIAHAIDLKQRGLAAAYRPIRRDEVYEEFRGIDPDDMFHTVIAGTMAILYNSDQVPEAEAPKNWPDLLDPKWKGKVAIGHPGFSGYVGLWAVKMKDLYGLEFFEKMAEQNPYIGRSSIDVATTTASGESAVGAGPAASAGISAARGNPLATVYPTDGTVVITSPTVIPKAAPHPNAARLFLEFQLGQEFAEVIAADYGNPIRPGVPLADGVPALDEITLISPTVDQMVSDVTVVAEEFRDIFGI